jgi:hypothetical protein
MTLQPQRPRNPNQRQLRERDEDAFKDSFKDNGQNKTFEARAEAFAKEIAALADEPISFGLNT